MNTETAATSVTEPVATAIAADLLQRILEGALLAAGKPLTVDELGALFDEQERPSNDTLRAALATIAEQCSGRGFQLREVASGYRFQVVQEVAPWIARLWEEKPQKYSRALLETLALIAYRQPITRGDIEDIRGVAVATNIIKTLLEREWVRVVGHKDVPGRPAMYATTRKFLDYFNLQNLDDLPSLAEIRDLDSMNAELALEGVDTELAALDAELIAELGAVTAPPATPALFAEPADVESESAAPVAESADVDAALPELDTEEAPLVESDDPDDAPSPASEA
jgi:segregation and condensation protein B